MILANPGETIKLSWQQNQGDTSLYPRAVIKDSGGTTKATVDLTHDSNGLYAGTTSALVDEGTYSCQYLPYEDSGHTTLSGVDEIVSETISIQRSWRPSFDGAEATIPKTILNPLIKSIKNLEKELGLVKTELAKKSEFNPRKDIVKTDIKPTSMRFLIDKIDKIKMPSSIKIDNSQIISLINKLEKKIEGNKIDFTQNEIRIIGELKNQISNIKVSQDTRFFERLEKMIDMLHIEATKRDGKISGKVDSLTKMIMPFLKINNILERFKSEKSN